MYTADQISAVKENKEAVDIFVFVSEQWILVSVLMGLVYIYAWREKTKSGASLSVHGVTQLLNREEAVLLDVRDQAEFKEGHIVDAINIPHSSVAGRINELDKYKGKVIIIADKLGQHSGAAGRLLGDAGFDIRRLQGGMSEWSSQSLPVVK